MKALLTAATLMSAAALARAEESKSWEGYDKAVRWERSLEDAKARAAKEGKPILLYQLVGDLDKEGC